MNHDPCKFVTRSPIFFATVLVWFGTAILLPANCHAQKSNLEKALAFKPVQPGVDYDTPRASELEKCELKPLITADKKKGWLVYDANGRLVRRLIDMNGDGGLDLRSYFKNGIEVYRDTDTDFDKTLDEFRWLATNGMKWGIDNDGDGSIDTWRAISPEELSLEVVEAVKNSDATLFNSLLITDAEVKRLGVGPAQQAEILKRTKNARSEFAKFASSQKVISSDSEWIHFGGVRPGVIAAGTDDSTSDVVFYDSVAAVVDNGERAHVQLSIGTLIQVGNAWRIVDLPESIVEGVAVSNGSLFLQNVPVGNASALAGNTGAGGASEDLQELFREYDELEGKLAEATGAELQTLNQQRADLFEQLIESARSPENRSNWIRQMADMVSAAYQSGDYDDGVEFLKDIITELDKDKDNTSDVTYAKFRLINSFYSRSIAEATQKELPKIQDAYMSKLEEFVKLNSKDANTADAMLQLAMDDEAKGNINEAEDWYSRIIREFPQSPLVNRARGAAIRLGSEGKKIAFSGTTLQGRPYSLSDHQGKVVLIQFWGTWSETCKNDLRLIKEAYNDYNRKGFEVVSVSLDYDVDDLKAYLRTNPLPWTQLYADGDLDSPLSEQLGIAMIPTMILVDAEGKVLDRSVLAVDIDRLLSRQFSRTAKRERK